MEAMSRYLKKSPDVILRDEAEMRAFYQSCGISPRTTEAAILARRNAPVEEIKPRLKSKSRKRMVISTRSADFRRRRS
jgi:hypothetical protein